MAKKVLKNKLKGALYVGALTFDAGEQKILDAADVDKIAEVENAKAAGYLSVSEVRIESDEVQGAAAPAQPPAEEGPKHGEDHSS